MSKRHQAGALSYAVRFRTVGAYLGQLCLILAVLHLVPAIVAVATRGWWSGFVYGVPVAVLAIVGGVLNRLTPERRIQVNEALVLSAATFLIGAAAATMPLASAGVPVADAAFEAISGVTTTGLTTTATVADKPVDFLFLRAWLQWYGGLGIVVMSLALVLRPGPAARRLAATEGAENEGLAAGTRVHARRALKYYAAVTAVAMGVVVLLGVPPFTALVHVLAAVSTGGFSSFDNSLAGLGSWWARAALLFFSFGGAISLTLCFRCVQHRAWREFLRDLELRSLLIAALVVSTALCLLMYRESVGDAVRNGLAMGFSAQTTTGFSTTNVGSLGNGAKLVMIVAMFIGGDMGSTAGGVKIVRLLILLRLLQLLLLRTSVTPHAVVPARLGDRKLEDADALDALSTIGMFAGVAGLSWLIFVIYGYAPLDSLFDVVSATGTVGLSTGVTGPHLPGVLKAVLCVDMLMGRLEVLALVALVYPRTWFGKRVSVS